MAPFRILISGAGIAGPALALFLARRDCDVTIVERAEDLRATGQQIDLRAQGVPIMKKMGIEAAVREKIIREPGMRIIDRDNRSLAFVPALQTGTGRQNVTSEYEIMRGDLVNILYDATRELKGVRYIFGQTVESLEQDDAGDGPVRVRLSGGDSREYDLVVGADGVSSHTRRLMRGADGPDVRQSNGIQIALFSVPAREDDPRDFTVCTLAGGRMAMTRRDRPDLLRVLLFKHGDVPGLAAADRSGQPMALRKQAWASAFADAGWQAPRFADALLHAPEADDLYAQRLEQIRLPAGGWGRGRVVLVGDAAACVALSHGMGTTLGLLAAYTLAGELARHCLPADGRRATTDEVVRAVQEYETKLRPLVQSTQRGVPAWVRKMMFPKTERGLWWLQTVIWLIFFLRLNRVSSLIPTAEEDYSWHEYPELEVSP